MRRVALGLVGGLLCAGCNQIFGIQETIAVDGAGPGIDGRPDAPFLGSFLTWGIGTTKTDGTPDPVILFPAIGSEALRPDQPTIQAGPPLDLGALVDEAYNVADGSFTVPVFMGHPSRIVYRLPGDPVPHEVQSALVELHLMIPRATRLDAPLPPNGGGYDISPASVPGVGFLQPSIWTTGVFTNTFLQNSERVGKRVMFQYTQHAIPLAGPSGAPEKAKGDLVVLLDWVNTGDPSFEASGYAVTKLDLGSSLSIPAAQPVWSTTKEGNYTPQIATSNRMINAMGALTGTLTERMIFGLAPTPALVPFVPTAAAVEEPVIFPLVDRPFNRIDPINPLLINPAQVPFPEVLYSNVSLSHTTNGVVLTSSMQVMWPVPRVNTAPLFYPASLATGESLGTVQLNNDTSTITISKASNSFVFTFTPDAGTGIGADDAVVTVFEIVGTAVTPIRTYQVLQSPVQIDRELFQQGHTYVLATTCHHGFTNAATGDFTAINAAAPFGSSTKFAAVFTIGP
jgi:hypothetical protein